MKIISSFIELETGEGIALHDLMSGIREAIANVGIKDGFVTVTSQHTTTAIAINENEACGGGCESLFNSPDFPNDRYLHNDIALRECPPDEPENAHSHLAAMLLGGSEVIALANEALIGKVS